MSNARPDLQLSELSASSSVAKLPFRRNPSILRRIPEWPCRPAKKTHICGYEPADTSSRKLADPQAFAMGFPRDDGSDAHSVLFFGAAILRNAGSGHMDAGQRRIRLLPWPVLARMDRPVRPWRRRPSAEQCLLVHSSFLFSDRLLQSVALSGRRVRARRPDQFAGPAVDARAGVPGRSLGRGVLDGRRLADSFSAGRPTRFFTPALEQDPRRRRSPVPSRNLQSPGQLSESRARFCRRCYHRRNLLRSSSSRIPRRGDACAHG